jgi:peptidoglycan/xylan/chitin deacetylase (PgdA/CDA1 family)
LPLLENFNGKRQHLRFFSRLEQERLIRAAIELIEMAGGGTPRAFRAGSFAFNRDTLRALSAAGIRFDSSYNACQFGRDSGLSPETITDIVECEGVFEYPMTVFTDGIRRARPAQLTACSFNELEDVLWKARDGGQSAFVILSHNFELLNLAKNRPDDIVVQRFRKL